MNSRQEYWSAELPRESLTADVPTAVLVLRLGIAVNATRAAQRFYLAVRVADGPGGERDRLWAFLIAAGFLNEALQVLRPSFPVVRALAEAGGATVEQTRAAGELLSGRQPINKVLGRLRNQLVFHWDEELIRDFIASYTKDTVVWADGLGDSNGEMIYRAAADAITDSLLPRDVTSAEPDEHFREGMKALLIQLKDATDAVIQTFDYAIAGYLSKQGIAAGPKAG